MQVLNAHASVHLVRVCKVGDLTRRPQTYNSSGKHTRSSKCYCKRATIPIQWQLVSTHDTQ
eukprot:3154199-Amphidinium_carterae.1